MTTNKRAVTNCPTNVICFVSFKTTNAGNIFDPGENEMKRELMEDEEKTKQRQRTMSAQTLDWCEKLKDSLKLPAWPPPSTLTKRRNKSLRSYGLICCT